MVCRSTPASRRWVAKAWRLFRMRNSRHTTATHLLRAGVDINTIRAWIGHVSVETTNVYAEIDLATKAKALATCAIQPDPGGPPLWKDNRDLLVFLHSL